MRAINSTLRRLFFFFSVFQLLGEIEEHLNCTIAQVEPDIKVPVDDFDGKVTYGQKRALGGKELTTSDLPCYAMLSCIVVCCVTTE